MCGPFPYRHTILAVVTVCVAMVDFAAGQTVRSNNLAVEFERAQQFYDEGNYRQAAGILERIVGDKTFDKGVGPESIGAIRLLAQVYHRSTDYVAAVRTAERFMKFAPAPDSEMLLILADSNLALGRTQEARRQLEFAASTLKNQNSGNAADARLAIEAQRISDSLRRATTGSQPVVAKELGHASGTPPEKKMLPTDFQQEQRFEVVTLTVNNYQDTNRTSEAIGLLTHELSSPAYDANELVDLRLQLVDCYRRQSMMIEDSADRAGRETVLAAEDRALDLLAADFTRQRTQAAGIDDFLKLLPREGTLYERRAELARAAAQVKKSDNPAAASAARVTLAVADQQLQAAAKCYQELALRADELERAEHESRNPLQKNGSDPSGRADQYRDLALCGLQRVYEALRQSAESKSLDRLNSEVCRVSDQLVAERSRRLLPTDPALYDAKRADASVYASIDDRVSHKRAVALYRELVTYWEANPHPQPEPQAAALIGLADMLRSLDQTKDSYQYAVQARNLLASPSDDSDPISRQEHALLVARIENSLGVASIAVGEYRDALKYLSSADQRLNPYGERAIELRNQNEQSLLLLSRVKVYRALLHKAEAQYNEAAIQVQTGRQLREQLNDNSDLLAYHLAEASIRLGQARELMQQQRLTSQSPPVHDALSEAEAALNRAEPLTSVTGPDGVHRQNDAALPHRYLRGVLLRTQGNPELASKELSNLAHDAEQQGDDKTAAKCYMQLAQLSMDAVGATPAKGSEGATNESVSVSRAQASALRDLKIKRRAVIEQASEHADRAVILFQKMDASPEDDLALSTLPSLHFQASYLAARLHILLATVSSHIARLDVLLSDNAATAPALQTALSGNDATGKDQRQRAIDLLEDAVRQAERPASSTTQVRLQRAKFFSRYAPAYDLLVDLYVAAAVGQSEEGRYDQSSTKFGYLRRAIEVADLARNRTFREQIDGWRRTAEKEHKSTAFDWNLHLREVVDPDTTLLIYYLDGPQLLDVGAAQSETGVASIGGGHLFVVLHQGTEIRYYRLRHAAGGTKPASSFSRDLASQLVRRHLEWIENPETTRDWGHGEQRALTECLLPHGLLDLIRSAPDRTAQRLLIVTDGALHQLPFDSLLLPESQSEQDRQVHYVIDDLPPIRYGSSLSVLAKINERAVADTPLENSILTVGNPSYPSVAQQNQMATWQTLLNQVPNHSGGFAPLIHSEEECESVYASFDDLPAGKRIKLVQAAATEEAVRKYISNSRYIHIAAHGCVDYQNDNLFGALVLTPGKDTHDPQNDGLLHLQEIYALNLSGCELAVLSACQTYVGAQRPLEAGNSMARAFLEQGARRVVCSQWSTDDRTTTELMKSFFETIRSARHSGGTIDYAAALHQAELAIRHDPERGSFPKYWAPFVLVGAP
jgi:CHAT domain-containing protein